MSITYLTSGSMLNNLLGAVPFTPPANYYVGLSTTTVSKSGSNISEPIGATLYARVQVPNNKTYFSYAVSGSLTNSTDIVFPTSGSAWGTILDAFLADTSASGTGNIWFYQTLPSPRVVQDLTTITFSASSLNFSMTN